MAVRGIEHSPVFLIATENGVWDTTEVDYVSDASLLDIIGRLQPGEHVYLVHLDRHDAEGRVRLTELCSGDLPH